ncbi:hypothetical protein Tco_0480869 [Tanacetum coccineum]
MKNQRLRAEHKIKIAELNLAGTSVHVAESLSNGHPLYDPEFETETLSATPSQGSSADDFYESQTIDSATALNVYAMLRNQHDAGFLDSFNINSSQHICMVFELCLRYEHEIMIRDKYEKRFTNSVTPVQQRDAEVAELKAKLEKSKFEAAEVDELYKCVSDLEATVVIKVSEASSLTAQNAGLLEKVSALELERNGLKGQVVDKSKMREEFIVGHGFRLAVHKCARSLECRSALGKDISMAINKSIQEGLEAGVVHGRAGRSLAQIEACNPKVKGKYVAAVFDFEGMSFPLLDELESLKYYPLALIMYALALKDDQGNTYTTPEFAQFQPSLDQSAKRRGLCPPLSSALGGTSSSVPPHDSSVGVADYHVSTLVMTDDGEPTNLPPVI